MSVQEGDLIEFVRKVISDHKQSNLYRTAKIAYDYARRQNTTITKYQKMLYTLSGKAVPDNWSANYKISSNFFNRFVTQQNQYLLGKYCISRSDMVQTAYGLECEFENTFV